MGGKGGDYTEEERRVLAATTTVNSREYLPFIAADLRFFKLTTFANKQIVSVRTVAQTISYEVRLARIFFEFFACLVKNLRFYRKRGANYFFMEFIFTFSVGVVNFLFSRD